jgi:signal transduction histidine kinase
LQEVCAALDREPLLYNLRPTAPHVRTASLVAFLSLVGFLAAFFFRYLQLAKVNAFIPVVDTALFLGDVVIATLLFSQAWVLRSKALMALGTGYLFTALIIIPHAMAFPWAFSPTGLLGGGLGTTSWLYYFWHCGLPVAVIAYSLLRNSPEWPQTASRKAHSAIVVCLMFATVLAGMLTLLATVGEPLLPQMMVDPIRGYAEKVLDPAFALALLIVAAMAMIWRTRTSVLDLWLLFALWAWFLDLLLSTTTHSRFTVGWYSGRMLGLLSSLFVLLMLLAETSKLYARAVIQVRARNWEQENRLMIRDAIAASIAHELRQPLAATLLNAQAAQRHVPKSDSFMCSILDDIVSSTNRANEIIASTREIFGQSTTQKNPTNMNQLVRETLVLISRNLREKRVSVNLELDDSLHPIAVNHLQMEQVFYNLFLNAAEAMSAVNDKPRVLTIRSHPHEKGLMISVEDTGPGIAAADQEQIFELSYTTKAHGMGLGLSICRSVITANGGRIRAITGPSAGAIFEVCLPYNVSAETEFSLPLPIPRPSMPLAAAS